MQEIVGNSKSHDGRPPDPPFDECLMSMGPLARCPLFFHTEDGNPS